ncbi:hypothetical protein DFQ27_002773 [Actinomortierella ambigua]|uniref:ASX DEUBAD domain-containing protein n=1 Tax=Actinomortierella ambigua TaxID=1343610 RepID=A0A9P6QB12_9FUNG|nr:hypothetical protein DFQ27_002773 [Actinomortierella ambigua]
MIRVSKDVINSLSHACVQEILTECRQGRQEVARRLLLKALLIEIKKSMSGRPARLKRKPVAFDAHHVEVATTTTARKSKPSEGVVVESEAGGGPQAPLPEGQQQQQQDQQEQHEQKQKQRQPRKRSSAATATPSSSSSTPASIKDTPAKPSAKRRGRQSSKHRASSPSPSTTTAVIAAAADADDTHEEAPISPPPSSQSLPSTAPAPVAADVTDDADASTTTLTNKRPQRSSSAVAKKDASAKEAIATAAATAASVATPKRSGSGRGANKNNTVLSNDTDNNNDNDTDTKKKKTKASLLSSSTPQATKSKSTTPTTSTTAKTKAKPATSRTRTTKVVSKPSLEDLLMSPTSPLVSKDLKTLIHYDNYQAFSPEERASLEALLPDCIKQQSRFFVDGQLKEGFFKYSHGFNDFLVEWQDALAASFFTEEYERKAKRALLKQQRQRQRLQLALEREEEEEGKEKEDKKGHGEPINNDNNNNNIGHPLSSGDKGASSVPTRDGGEGKEEEDDDDGEEEDEDDDPSTWETWKDEAFEEYYGEKAFRQHEKDAVAGDSAKLLFPKLGQNGALELGDQMRFRWDYEFEVDADEEADDKKEGVEDEVAMMAVKEVEEEEKGKENSDGMAHDPTVVVEEEEEGVKIEMDDFSPENNLPPRLHQNHDDDDSMQQEDHNNNNDEPVITGSRRGRVPKRKFDSGELASGDGASHGTESKRMVKVTNDTKPKRKGKETAKERASPKTAKMKDGLQAGGTAAAAATTTKTKKRKQQQQQQQEQQQKRMVKKVVRVDERVVIVDFAKNGRPIVEFLPRKQALPARSQDTPLQAAAPTTPTGAAAKGTTPSALSTTVTLHQPQQPQVDSKVEEEKKGQQQLLSNPASVPSLPKSTLENDTPSTPLPAPIFVEQQADPMMTEATTSNMDMDAADGAFVTEAEMSGEDSMVENGYRCIPLTHSLSSTSLSSLSSDSTMSSLSSASSLSGVCGNSNNELSFTHEFVSQQAKHELEAMTITPTKTAPAATVIAEMDTLVDVPMPLAAEMEELSSSSSSLTGSSTEDKEGKEVDMEAPSSSVEELVISSHLPASKEGPAMVEAKKVEEEEKEEAKEEEKERARYVVDTPGMLVDLIHTVRSTQVPEHVWNVSRRGAGGVDSWKAIEVIRRGCLVGSLFGVRMDLWEKNKVKEQRRRQHED